MDSNAFQVEQKVSTSENGDILFNGHSHKSILEQNRMGLTMYQRVCAPRILLDESISEEPLNPALFAEMQNILQCPMCLDVLNDPVCVKRCLHKFCASCIEKYNRLEKKQCPSCRADIGSRRVLRHDRELQSIIETVIPDIEGYREFEEHEYVRTTNSEKFKTKCKGFVKQMEKQKQMQNFYDSLEKRRTPRVRSYGSLRAVPPPSAPTAPATRRGPVPKLLGVRRNQERLTKEFKVQQLEGNDVRRIKMQCSPNMPAVYIKKFLEQKSGGAVNEGGIILYFGNQETQGGLKEVLDQCIVDELLKHNQGRWEPIIYWKH